MLRFDEACLAQTLNTLPLRFTVAFAAACAERLFPCYLSYCNRTGHGNPDLFAQALKETWGYIKGDVSNTAQLSAMHNQCTELIPNEDETFAVQEPYAADAAAVVTYTLRAVLTGEIQNVIWAARRVYDALDNYTSTQLHADFQQRGTEERILRSPLIQHELEKQQRDLDDLVAAVKQPAQAEQLLNRLHERACRERITVCSEKDEQRLWSKESGTDLFS